MNIHEVKGKYAIHYGRYSKIWITFLFLFLYKMLVFSAGINKMLVRISNRQDPDQTASSKQSDLGLHCLSWRFWHLVFKILEHLWL